MRLKAPAALLTIACLVMVIAALVFLSATPATALIKPTLIDGGGAGPECYPGAICWGTYVCGSLVTGYCNNQGGCLAYVACCTLCIDTSTADRWCNNCTSPIRA